MPLCRQVSLGKSLAVVAALLLAAGTPAFAGGIGEMAYADSFGNLIIRSPAGYKRIIVGKGYLADSFAHGAPKVVYLEEEDDGHLYLRERKRCRYGALLHGRSYMYGLPDNVVPVPTVCP